MAPFVLALSQAAGSRAVVCVNFVPFSKVSFHANGGNHGINHYP